MCVGGGGTHLSRQQDVRKVVSSKLGVGFGCGCGERCGGSRVSHWMIDEPVAPPINEEVHAVTHLVCEDRLCRPPPATQQRSVRVVSQWSCLALPLGLGQPG